MRTLKKGRGKSPSARRGDLRMALFFIAPAALGFLVFYAWPTVRGIYLSFTEYSLFGSPEFVGLDNYTAIASDALFWNSMKVTLWYVVLNIGFQTLIALGLAVLMHRLTKSGIIRGSILLPFLIANVVVALLWFWMLDFQIGIVNTMIESIGLDKIAFFGNENWAIPTIAFVNVWKHMGYTALLIFAGLQTIPTSVYEAAAVDGANEWKTFWRITLPLLRPVLVLVLIITVTGSFQVFDTVAITTGGGPAILFVILGLVAYLQNKFLRGGESDLA
jgi:multiple sugar transport system permease protein